jgi:cytochrome c-type biogenesis protein CcmF
MLVVLAAAVGLALARRRELQGEGQVGDLLSREFVFLVTNLLFLGSAAAVLLGTLWPTFTETVRGMATSLSAENYNRFMGPLGLLLVLLIGVCPLIEWRQISATRLLRSLWVQLLVGLVTAVLLVVFRVREAWAVVSFAVTAFVAATVILQMGQGIVARMRAAGENLVVATGQAIRNNRRRYGGQLIHFAILLIVMGITGSQAYQSEVQVALAAGESVEVEGYTLTYRSYTYGQIEESGNKVLNQAVVDVQRNGRTLATVRPERNLHSNSRGPITEVALRSNMAEDLYLVLASLDADGLAAFQVLVTPLVVWLWIGGGVLLAGTLIAAWPVRAREAKE